MKQATAIIPAAGNGRRYGGSKQFANLAGEPVLSHATRPFLRNDQVQRIIIIVRPEDERTANEAIENLDTTRIEIRPVGGETRAASVSNGLTDCDEQEWVLVHDAARPCLPDESLHRLLAATDKDGGLLALPISDALKTVANDKTVTDYLPRDKIWAAQTPQLFRAGPLRRALQKHPDAADEAEAMNRDGAHPTVIIGDPRNIKITHPEDLSLAEYLIREIRPETVALS